MPELPDITIYVERMVERVAGRALLGIRLASPFLLRTVHPGVADLKGRVVTGVTRIGKRIVISLQGDVHAVIHLMIAGRFRWLEPTQPPGKVPGRFGLAAFDFDSGTLLLTEASTKKRASLHLVAGSLAAFERGGLELAGSSTQAFTRAMTRTRHTVKRALTDPTILSGVGNAYSDEILHAARLSPFRMTDKLDAKEWRELHAATLRVLDTWTDRLRAIPGFPEKVTAFRPEMAVHGRYGKACPVCGQPVQRIVYASNEANYCAQCQTGSRLLMDRSLSRLLRDDWPKTLEELEERNARRSGPSTALRHPPPSTDSLADKVEGKKIARPTKR